MKTPGFKAEASLYERALPCDNVRYRTNKWHSSLAVTLSPPGMCAKDDVLCIPPPSYWCWVWGRCLDCGLDF